MSQVKTHKKSQSLILPISYLEFTKDLKHRVIEDGGKQFVALKWDLEAYGKLKDIVPECPHPMQAFYDWPKLNNQYEAMPHQQHTAQFIVDNNKCLVLNSTGTGKTLSILYAIDYLLALGEIDKAVIISPISTLHAVWASGIKNSFPSRTHEVLYGSKPKRVELLSKNPNIAIINPDGIVVLQKELKSRTTNRTLWVVDEASQFRNAAANIHKALTSFMSPKTRLCLATATPCPNSPLNAFALAKLINPETPRFFGAWRKMVCREISFGGFKKYEPLPTAHLVVSKYLQPAIFYHKDQCLHLPSTTFNYREVELSPEQTKHYKKMKNEMVHEFGDGEKLTAINGADMLTKLRQILCGVVKIGDGVYSSLDYSPRLKVLREIADETDGSIVVVIPFKGILKDLHEQLSKHYSCEYVNGDTNLKERTEIFERFQTVKDTKILLIHPRVASHGISLHASNSLVFWSAVYSGDEHEQLLGRISRAGQDRHMTVTYLYGDKLEEKIYKRLEERKNLQSSLLDLYKEAILT